jgi:hypothetical protein
MKNYISEIIHFDALSREYYKQGQLEFEGFDTLEQLSQPSGFVTMLLNTSQRNRIGSISWEFYENASRQDGLDFNEKRLYIRLIEIYQRAQGGSVSIPNEQKVSYATLMVSEFLRVAFLNDKIDFVTLYIESENPKAARVSYVNAAIYLDLLLVTKFHENFVWFFYYRGNAPTLNIVEDRRQDPKRQKIEPIIVNRVSKEQEWTLVDPSTKSVLLDAKFNGKELIIDTEAFKWAKLMLSHFINVVYFAKEVRVGVILTKQKFGSLDRINVRDLLVALGTRARIEFVPEEQYTFILVLPPTHSFNVDAPGADLTTTRIIAKENLYDFVDPEQLEEFNALQNALPIKYIIDDHKLKELTADTSEWTDRFLYVATNGKQYQALVSRRISNDSPQTDKNKEFEKLMTYYKTTKPKHLFLAFVEYEGDFRFTASRLKKTKNEEGLKQHFYISEEPPGIDLTKYWDVLTPELAKMFHEMSDISLLLSTQDEQDVDNFATFGNAQEVFDVLKKYESKQTPTSFVSLASLLGKAIGSFENGFKTNGFLFQNGARDWFISYDKISIKEIVMPIIFDARGRMQSNIFRSNLNGDMVPTFFPMKYAPFISQIEEKVKFDYYKNDEYISTNLLPKWTKFKQCLFITFWKHVCEGYLNEIVNQPKVAANFLNAMKNIFKDEVKKWPLT